MSTSTDQVGQDDQNAHLATTALESVEDWDWLKDLQHLVPGEGGPAAGGLRDQDESDSGSVTNARSDDNASDTSLTLRETLLKALSECPAAIFNVEEPVAVATELPMVMAIPMPSPNSHAPSPARSPAAVALQPAVASAASVKSFSGKVTEFHGTGHEPFSVVNSDARGLYTYEDTGGRASLEPNAAFHQLWELLTNADTTFPFWSNAQNWQYNTAVKQKAADSDVDENEVVITMEQQRYKSCGSIANGYSTKQPFAVKGDPLDRGVYYFCNRKEGSAWQTTLVHVTNVDYAGLQAAVNHMCSSTNALPGDDIPVEARLVYLTEAGSGDHVSITPLSYTLGEENGLFQDKMSSATMAPCTVSDPEAPFEAIDIATGEPIIVHPNEERYRKTSRLIKDVDGDAHVLTHIATDGTLAQALLTRDKPTSSDGLSRAFVNWAMHADLQSNACTGGVANKGRFFRLYTTPAHPRLRHLSKLSAHSPAFLISTNPGRESAKRKARPPGLVDPTPRGVARNA